MTPSDTNKTDNTEIEQLLRDFNGYDFCERNECPGQAKANELIKYLETIITQRCREARIDELKKIWSHAREHTITDIEMIEHHTGLDFIEAVDTKHLEDRIAALSKEGE